MKKEDRSDLFRTRLNQRLAASGMSRSALARSAGVDRSTIAQLLSGDDVRLPNAHLAAECAAALGVSLFAMGSDPEPSPTPAASAGSAQARASEIVGVYLADAKQGAEGPEPVHFREAFRTRGPSNYPHGKQTEL